MTTRALVYGLLVLWSLFAAGSYLYPTNEVFHHLNAVAVAAGLMTLVSYSPILVDAWRQRKNGGISAAHILAFGIISNWLGFTIRLGRWYVTSSHPVAGGIPAWAYNIGLWISTTAAVLLVAALALSDPPWSAQKVWWHVLAFICLTAGLWMLDYVHWISIVI